MLQVCIVEYYSEVKKMKKRNEKKKNIDAGRREDELVSNTLRLSRLHNI